MSTIHADMLTLQSAYPWQTPDLVAAEDADIVAFHDAAREAWLDDWLADLLEEPAVEEADELVTEYDAAAYVPFQQPAAVYADHRYLGPLTEEPGYYETLCPYLF